MCATKTLHSNELSKSRKKIFSSRGIIAAAVEQSFLMLSIHRRHVCFRGMAAACLPRAGSRSGRFETAARSLPRQPFGDPSQSASEELPSLAFSTHLFKFSLCHPSVRSHHYVTPGSEKAAVALTMPPSPSRSLSYVTVLCCYLTISVTTGFPS